MFELRDVSFLVPARPQELVLLGDVSAVFPSGSLTALAGPAGAGKSLLLRLLAGLVAPTFGEVIHGAEAGMPPSADAPLSPARPAPVVAWIPSLPVAFSPAERLLSVEEQLDDALRLRVAGLTPAARRERVAGLLEKTGLTAMAGQRLAGLSADGQRRLSLAVELAGDPALILLDAFTQAQDPESDRAFTRLLAGLAGEGRTIVQATHALDALGLYDAALVLAGGQLAYHGPPEFLAHYFQIDAPRKLYKQLAQRRPEDWHRSWVKHGGAYRSDESRGWLEGEVGAEQWRSFQEKQARRSGQAGEPVEKQEGKQAGESPLPEPEGKQAGESPSPEPVEKQAGESALPKPAAPLRRPHLVSQGWTLLARRWRVAGRDGVWLGWQLALTLGLPALVALFAATRLADVRELSVLLAGESGESLERLLQLGDAAFSLKARVGVEWLAGIGMLQCFFLAVLAVFNGSREIAGERLAYERGRLGGLSPLAYVAAKWAFLLPLALAQAAWMGAYVHWACRLPGSLAGQIGVLALVNLSLTAVCLGVSSLMGIRQGAGGGVQGTGGGVSGVRWAVGIGMAIALLQWPFVAFPGGGLALPEALNGLARPLVTLFWGTGAWMQTMAAPATPLLGGLFAAYSPLAQCPGSLGVLILAIQGAFGLLLGVLGVCLHKLK